VIAPLYASVVADFDGWDPRDVEPRLDLDSMIAASYGAGTGTPS
jgi:hypothetical protein